MSPPNDQLHDGISIYLHRFLRYHHCRPSTEALPARHTKGATFQVPVSDIYSLFSLRSDVCHLLVCMLEWGARKAPLFVSAYEGQRKQHCLVHFLCLHHPFSQP